MLVLLDEVAAGVEDEVDEFTGVVVLEPYVRDDLLRVAIEGEEPFIDHDLFPIVTHSFIALPAQPVPELRPDLVDHSMRKRH